MNLWRATISLLLAFSVSVSQADTLICSQLFKNSSLLTQASQRVQVLDGTNEGSELRIRPLELSTDPEIALKDLLYQLASTRSLSLSKKMYLKNGELHLGYDVGDGYKIEITYKEADPILVIKRGILITPSNREKLIFENFLELQELKPQNFETFDLSNVYPNYKKIQLSVPLKIEAAVLAKLKEFAPRFEYLEKSEIKKMVSENNIYNITETAQKRYLKQKFLHYWDLAKYKFIVKVPFKILSNGLGIAFFAVVSFTNVGHDIKEFFVPDQKAWVTESLNRLEVAFPAEVKAEILALEQLTAAALKVKNTSVLKDNLDSAKFKISATQYVWIAEGLDQNTGSAQTFFVVSQDNKKGQIEYYAVQIESQKYPNLINYFSKTGRLLKSKND